MALSDGEFETLAGNTLERILDAADSALGAYLDADMEAGILTLDLDSGGQYLINKHRPNRQIWMSSPQSGATHYGWDEKTRRWISTRGGGKPLLEILAEELSAATGENFSLD